MGITIWIGGLEKPRVFVGLLLYSTFCPKTSHLGRLWPHHIPLRAPLGKTSSNDAHHGVRNGATTPWGAGCLTIPKGSIAAYAPFELI